MHRIHLQLKKRVEDDYEAHKLSWQKEGRKRKGGKQGAARAPKDRQNRFFWEYVLCVCIMYMYSIVSHTMLYMYIISIYLSIYLSMYLIIYLSINLSIHPAIYLSIYLYIHANTHTHTPLRIYIYMHVRMLTHLCFSYFFTKYHERHASCKCYLNRKVLRQDTEWKRMEKLLETIAFVTHAVFNH